METTVRKKISLKWPAALGLPVLGIVLFYLLRDNRPLMDGWLKYVMKPAEQLLGRIWAVFPFSVAEVLIAVILTGIVVWVVRAVILLLLRRRGRDFLRRMLALISLALWLWCGLCWCWNVSYYATTFTEKSGLSNKGHSPQELLFTTIWFAQQAAELSTQIQRDSEGHFAEDQADYFRRGVKVYENLEEEFPFLKMDSVRTKPLVFSHLQSTLGFTGMYFPFTGEANVNVHAPACLRPATIAHEMSHQRMVASELEANFVGIAACISCDDVVFQYSGYLMGLIELGNALHGINPDIWSKVISTYFTTELRTDWNDNHYYWKALESKAEEVAEQTYDSFLKGNGQTLGIASYGACVDLLITYYLTDAIEALRIF